MIFLTKKNFDFKFISHQSKKEYLKHFIFFLNFSTKQFPSYYQQPKILPYFQF
jgi:hypothetical protein